MALRPLVCYYLSQLKNWDSLNSLGKIKEHEYTVTTNEDEIKAVLERLPSIFENGTKVTGVISIPVFSRDNFVTLMTRSNTPMADDALYFIAS